MKKILLCVISLVLLTSCSGDRKFVNLALKKDHKVYLVPFIASRVVLEQQLSENETPTIFKFLGIIEDNGELFVETKDLEKILNLIGNNYVLLRKEEKAHDGYVAFGDMNIYNYSIKTINTDKIGQQIYKPTIVVTNPSTNKTLEIVWSSIPEPTAEKNCTNKRVFVTENPYPGKTVGSYKKVVVVNLNDILDFFDNGTTLEYDKSEKILYVVKQ